MNNNNRRLEQGPVSRQLMNGDDETSTPRDKPWNKIFKREPKTDRGTKVNDAIIYLTSGLVTRNYHGIDHSDCCMDCGLPGLVKDYNESEEGRRAFRKTATVSIIDFLQIGTFV